MLSNVLDTHKTPPFAHTQTHTFNALTRTFIVNISATCFYLRTRTTITIEIPKCLDS